MKRHAHRQKHQQSVYRALSKMRHLPKRILCAYALLLGPLLGGKAGLATEAPSADFEAAPLACDAPLEVGFTDLSTGDPAGWTWYFGDEQLDGVWTHTETVTNFPARYHHSSVVTPDGSIVVMAGLLAIGYAEDAWRLPRNGDSWQRMTAAAPWGRRFNHSSVALPDGSILLLGGDAPGERKNDVWRSEDEGATWSLLTGDAAWAGRFSHRCVVTPDGNVILTGGQTGNVQNDVWRSSDGGNSWTNMTNNAPWAARRAHESVALPDGSVLVMGGLVGGAITNDVWRSTDDGASWQIMTDAAPWARRRDFGSVALPDGSVVVMGGVTYEGFDTIPLRDVWVSRDQGVTWQQVKDAAEWSARERFTAEVLYDGRIALLGGYIEIGLPPTNDLWTVSTAGSTHQHPSHVYAAGGAYTVALRAYNDNGYSTKIEEGYITASIPTLVAAFSATPLQGAPPLSVDFDDESEGSPAGWAWYFGDEQLDGDWQFVADAPWAGRDKFSAAFLPSGEIVVAGGYNNIGPSWMDNDVWRSNDGGATWIQITSSAAWSARMGHQLLALSDGGILLMGGWAGSVMRDVWRSDDKGATWTRLTESAGWSERGYFTVEELPDGSVVLIGGHNGLTSLSDVWRSTDGGSTWQEMTSAAEFGVRSSHASAVLPDGALLLIGGQIPDHPWYQNDVWRSDDAGATWVQVTASAAWSGRVNHAAVALPDGSVLLLGGYEGTSVNDVWRSNDGGATWSLLEGTVGWSTRMQFAAGVQPDGAVILLGGNDGTASSPKRDVWKLDTAGSYDQHPTHVYEHPGAYTVTLQVFNENGKDRLIRNQYIRVGMRPSDGEIVEARRPLFAWPDVEGATWYQVWIQRNGQKHLSTWVEGENSWTPDSDLAGGSYQWWIRSWGAEIGMGAWSTVNDFTVPFAPPGGASPQSPQGAQALGERRPEFSWTAAVPAATWFQIWVNRNGRTHLTQWVEGTTPWTPPDDLPAGNYEWWVRGWNVDGYGAWSDPAASFSIPTMQPGALTQLMPQGQQLARHLTYHWDKDARATWYRLWVGSVGAGTLHDQWHALAGEGVAVVDPGALGPEVARPVPVEPQGAIADTQPTFRWAGGEYTWWVRGRGPDGSGPWTGPMAFSMPYAPDTWTRVYVNRGGVTVLDDWTQDGELHSPMALQPGDHSWWLGVWDANAGRTIWSDRMDFTVP